MAKKKKTQTPSSDTGLAKKYLSMKYMGVGTTMSQEEFEAFDKTIDGLEEAALTALKESEWRKNTSSEDDIVIGEELKDGEKE